MDLITKNVLGFSSTIIGLQGPLGEENHFYELDTVIKTIWNTARREAESSPANVGDIAAVDDADDLTVDTSGQVEAVKEADELVIQPKLVNLHLKRNHVSERVFFPSESKIDKVGEEPAVKKRKISALKFP